VIDDEMRRAWRLLEEVFPAHTCVDQPDLTCPACLKWTGDGFATVRTNSQFFSDVAREQVFDTTHFGTSGYAVMIRVRLLGGWAWRTLMRYDSEAEALAHAREGSKVVPFGSPEWLELQNMKDVAPPGTAREPVTQQDVYRLVESVLRFFHRHFFLPDDANAVADVLHASEDLVHQPLDSK